MINSFITFVSGTQARKKKEVTNKEFFRNVLYGLILWAVGFIVVISLILFIQYLMS